MKRLLLVSLFLIGCGSSDTKVEPIDTVEPPVKKVEIVSHRGIKAKDNTIEGFQNAINLGFDSIEMDLRVYNGEVILAHDKAVQGVEYDTFSDLLIFAGNAGVKIWVEAKEPEVIKPVVELLSHYGFTNYIFTSFKQSDINEFKLLMPNAETGLIVQDLDNLNCGCDWIIASKKLIPFNTDKKVAVWTIKENSEYSEYSEFADAVISDVEIY